MFRLTEQYSRSEETVSAEFNALNDAMIFLAKKSSNQALIYRLYDDDVMIQTSNAGNISIAYAQYAEGSADIDHTTRFNVSVTLQAENDKDRNTIAQFNHELDAYAFIVSKCERDNTVQPDDLFIIFKEQSVIDRLSITILASRDRKSDKSRAHDQALSFHPAPMHTTLKPPGFTKDYWVDEEEDKR